MLTFSLPIKPLSVNMAWQGRRFKTRIYQTYEHQIFLLAPRALKQITGPVEMRIVWHFKYCSKSDVDNCIKPLLDALVKAGVLVDDRFIYRLVVEKVQDTVDSVDVEIFPFQAQDTRV